MSIKKDSMCSAINCNENVFNNLMMNTIFYKFPANHYQYVLKLNIYKIIEI